MSRYFSANQFDREFAPKNLCNWEVPRPHRPKPLHRKGNTKVISNDRGHLLSGIPRLNLSPARNYENTVDLSKHKTKECVLEPTSNVKTGVKDSSKKKGHKNQNFDEICDYKNLSYKPGDLTEPDQQHHSRSLLEEKTSVRLPELNDLYVEKPAKSNELDVKPFEPGKCCLPEQTSPKDNNSLSELTEQLPQIEKMRQEVSEKPGASNTIPLIPACCNFQAARKMAQENLEHQPLPDSIMDRTFLKMQAQGLLNPELSLDVEPKATGVGVRTHNAGPTHCTKLKVYRPKTCGVVPPPIDSRNQSRPQTAFSHKNKIEPMDLAICWDYTPENPLDEPKPSAHIDGSNDIVAPAIFSVVKTPRATDLHNTGRSAGVFAHTAGEESFFDKDIMNRNKNYFSAKLEKNTDRTCKCKCSGGSRSNSASRKESLQEQLQPNNRCKSSPNLSILVHPSEDSTRESIIVCNYNREHYHYRPEPTKRRHKSAVIKKQCDRSRPPRLCEQNIQKLNHQTKEKPECKAAFVARSHSSGFCSSIEHTSNSSNSTASEFTSKIFKIPKPRQPYAKKNYSIDTLAPPFACWRGGAGNGGNNFVYYPEHCRLASVYQHAYNKPTEQRKKRPFLTTVFQ